MYFLHWFSMDSVKVFMVLKFILVPSSGVEPLFLLFLLWAFFYSVRCRYGLFSPFTPASKGVPKRIKTSFHEKQSLEYYLSLVRVEIFSRTAPELGIRSGTFTFAGTKGINRSGSDTELLAKSRQRRAVKQYIALAIPPVGRATGWVGRCVNAIANQKDNRVSFYLSTR